MSSSVRQKILTTTSDLLERQGYHATGLNQIVKESATPRGSLYYHFPDGKEEIASQAVLKRMSAVTNYTRQCLTETEDPAEAIHAFITEMAHKMAQQECCTGAPIAAVALEASNTSVPIRQACAESYQSWQDVFAAKLVMGGLTAERATGLATTIIAAIEGAMILSRTKQDAHILMRVADDLKILVQSALPD